MGKNFQGGQIAASYRESYFFGFSKLNAFFSFFLRAHTHANKEVYAVHFCLGMSESYLDDKCAAELLDWACGTGMGLQYIGFIIL